MQVKLCTKASCQLIYDIGVSYFYGNFMEEFVHAQLKEDSVRGKGKHVKWRTAWMKTPLKTHTHTTENSSKCSILQDTPWYFKVWDKCLCITVSSWKAPTLLSQNLLAEQVVLILSGYNSNCLEGSQLYYWRDLYRFPPSKLKPVQHQNRIWKPYVFMHSTKVTKEYHKLDRNITNQLLHMFIIK